MFTKEELSSQLREIGLKKGDIVNVKVSIKSIGKIDGGPNALIDAIMDVIGEEGTLVCDSFNPVVSAYTRFFKKKNIVDRYSRSYAGAFVNAVIKHKDSYRSNHPIQAFSAIGKYAQSLTESFTKDSKPYGFLEEIAKMGAVNLRIGEKVIGVGTTHIAIVNKGFEQKDLPCGVYYRDENGIVRFYRHHWASGCNTGFNKLFHYYEEGDAIIKKGKIGDAGALLTSMKKTLQIEEDLFEKDPAAFFCDNPACISCAFNWKHSKYSFFACFKENLKIKNYKRALYALCVKVFGVWHKC